MDSVIIVVPRPLEHRVAERLRGVDVKTIDVAGGFLLKHGAERAYLWKDDEVLRDFEERDARKIRGLVRDPAFYVLDFSSVDLCRRLICALADDADFLIDDDHGRLMRGDEFVAFLRSIPRGDWRVAAAKDDD